MKDLWYFAHPYTCKNKDGNNVHLGEEANFRQCCMMAADLIGRGYFIYAPICHTHPIHIHSPTFLVNNEWHLWLELDELIIDKTDFIGIILAPKWENSRGCIREKNKFEQLKKKVLFYEDIIKI